MKKILLGLGTITTIAIPVVSVIACTDVKQGPTIGESIKKANAEQTQINGLVLKTTSDISTGSNFSPSELVGFVKKDGYQYAFTTVAPDSPSQKSGDVTGTIAIQVAFGPVPSKSGVVTLTVHRV